jgi:hypothetical protein
MTTGLKHELYLDGAWRDITPDVRQSADTTCSRGLSGEALGGTASPGQCTLVVDNRVGDYTPRNPSGAWHGFLGRNTPHRMSVDALESHLLVLPQVNAGASVPDSAALSITGDMEIRADVHLDSWRREQDLVHKWDEVAGQRSYNFSVTSDGRLRFVWSVDGAAEVAGTANAVVPQHTGRLSVRVTYDADFGGVRQYRFFTSPDEGVDGTWTQLGTDVAGGATVVLFDGTAALRCGCAADSTSFFSGRVYSARLYSGIGGTVVADVDFRAQADGDTSFTGGAGETWTVNAGAEVVGRDYRHHGEVSEWPVAWDTSGMDCTAAVTSADPFRRLGKGQKALRSTYYRGCASTVAAVTGLRAYWPMEDASGSTTLASGLPGGPGMRVNGGPALASDPDSFPCSDALPVWAAGASAAGPVPAYASTNQVQVRALVAVPTGGVAAGTRMWTVLTTGTVPRWELSLATTGTLSLTAYDTGGAAVVSSGVLGFALNGAPVRVQLGMTQNGAGIDWNVTTLAPGAASGMTVAGNLAAGTVGRATWLAIAPDAGLGGVTLGQVTVQSVATSVYDLAGQLAAYDGETAADRVARLAGEESLAVVVLGGGPQSVAMGPQRSRPLLDLLHECETADGGILAGCRDRLGILYRARASMDSQAPAVTLSRTGGDLSALAITDDDQQLVNDLTVTRLGGSSYRYALTVGPLSTQAPPAGAGLYEATVTLGLHDDGQLPDAAAWRVHLGTTDLPRVPDLGVELTRPQLVADAARRKAVAGVEIGDRVDVTGMASQSAPDDMPQVVTGIRETITPFRRVLDFACRPAQPWNVARAGTGSRRAPDGATVSGAHTSTATALTVAGSGPLFGHGDGDYDLMVGSGERVRVTAVAGASWPQALTVTRSVNGVVKALAGGESVYLFDRCYYGM